MRLTACFLLGATVGTLLDGIHAYGDVLTYPSTAFGRWAWFVPLEFGMLGVAAGLVAPALERRFGPKDGIDFSFAQQAGELALFAGLYALTALVGDDQPALLAAALVALAAARLLALGVPGDLVYALAAALLGPTVEAILVALDVFSYANPDLAGVPVWLPALWANGGLLVRRLIVPVVVPRDRRSPDRRSPMPRAADSSSPVRSS
jgi:hypothetical protein